ncbi:hypothetical protein [Tomitella gaofuii]|uniref:hypothetical protein n=1 Tax=Tomitella gaofuii TaxID=2760083 RepID=UPI0015F92B27|nr:hypothetical protein [Tomitella gaofuii]
MYDYFGVAVVWPVQREERYGAAVWVYDEVVPGVQVSPVDFGVEVQMLGASEEVTGGGGQQAQDAYRQAVRTGYRIVSPPGTHIDVAPQCRVRVPGIGDLDVVGDPDQRLHPRVGHTTIRCERKVG